MFAFSYLRCKDILWQHSYLLPIYLQEFNTHFLLVVEIRCDLRVYSNVFYSASLSISHCTLREDFYYAFLL